MALRTPPSWLQNGSHPAENDRLTTQAQYATTGIIGAASMAVTAQASPNMTVNVASGWVAIVGSTANSGTYVAYNDATTVLTITTADATLPRIDRIVVTVSDAAYSGSTNDVAFQVLAGTPNASPVAPSTPSNSISLATISVPAGATTITSARITDTRVATTSNAFVLSTGGTLTGALSGTALTLSGSLTGTSVSLSGALSSTSTISTTSSISGRLLPAQGTTTVSPITMTDGNLLTTQTQGAIEMAVNMYGTLDTTTGRGFIPLQHSYLATSVTTLANNTSNQNIFPQQPTLRIGLYWFEVDAILSVQNNSKNVAFGLGGTAVLGSYRFYSISTQGANAAPNARTTASANPLTLFAAADTSTTIQVNVCGIINVTTSGTVAPYIAFSANPGSGTNEVAELAYVRFTRTPINGVGKWA